MTEGASLPARHVRTRFGPRQITDLLQTIFVSELVLPSRCLWIVSPWISDIAVIDDTANTFATVLGHWDRSRVRLSTVIGYLLRRGTTVHVAMRPNDHNREFIRRLDERIGEDPRLRLHPTDALHEKGILGDEFYLSGSMNFTYSGVTANEEVLHFFTDVATVAASRHSFTARWGGPIDA